MTTFIKFKAEQKTAHFFLIKIIIKSNMQGSAELIKLKFNVPQNKFSISRLPDSLKLKFEREKMHTMLFC